MRKAERTEIKFDTMVTTLFFNTLLANRSLPRTGNANIVDTRTCDVQDGREQIPAPAKNVLPPPPQHKHTQGQTG